VIRSEIHANYARNLVGCIGRIHHIRCNLLDVPRLTNSILGNIGRSNGSRIRRGTGIFGERTRKHSHYPRKSLFGRNRSLRRNPHKFCHHIVNSHGADLVGSGVRIRRILLAVRMRTLPH